ncbi:conserved hypothetical protein [Candidatus Desulfarcum epimagneticum]|uniref:Uncharacterized protein n=1 Tax=uncultured Desulfobacteraceae bacterium TaxID=218296 RepID=A0A484HJT2_9BACT|nr:conserved hypothetical protein [uncultured Desulfobacteraceae bacterium]
MIRPVYFIEHLTLRSWFFFILPVLIKKKRDSDIQEQICYYWDAAILSLMIAKFTAYAIGVSVKKLTYKMEDVRDEEGVSVRLKTFYKDFSTIHTKITNHSIFKDFVEEISLTTRLPSYLSKSLFTYSIVDTKTCDHLVNSILLIKIARWKSFNHNGNFDGEIVLFMRKRIWSWIIEEEAARHGVELIHLKSKRNINYKKKILRIVPSYILNALRYFIRYKREDNNSVNYSIPCAKSHPRIATEYYGHLNLDQPECYSDLFFLQESALHGQDIFLMFNLPMDPLNGKKQVELKKHKIESIALSPHATLLDFSSIYNCKFFPVPKINELDGSGPEIKWLNEKKKDYHWTRLYWFKLFSRFNIKVYTHWYKNDSSHMAIADAIKELGGVATIYQRSHESMGTLALTVAADIVFGFSGLVADFEKQNKSKILYHVTTGYIGDHRFPLLREQAMEIRESLFENGAEHILAYFDENTVDDPRWYHGHDFARKNYFFLLERVLRNENIGLVLKPKAPATLRQRLGPVTDLLEETMDTGRCYLFEGGAVQGSYPPAAAALAADIAIHENLAAGTAGFESALSGAPTLLMDFEGFPGSKLYELGVGRVVFKDWESVWDACRDYFFGKNNIEGFGDWSPIINDLDPFRDGRASERIGTYLKWLLDGFKAGLDRDTVMADAAERYCNEWGQDKIVSIP